jgi:hydrogenase/urease accessory protein HupE
VAGAAGLKRARRTLAAPAAVFFAVALAAGPARAHGATNVGDFYAGLMQPVYHLESLLLLLALGLFGGQAPAERRHAAPLAFAAATLVGAAVALLGGALPQAAWLVRGGSAALGLLVAARWIPGLRLSLLLAIALGVGQGQYAALGDRADLARPWLYALGLALGPLVVSGWLIALAERARAFWMQVGWRVVGSWIATIALLVMALELAGR